MAWVNEVVACVESMRQKNEYSRARARGQKLRGLRQKRRPVAEEVVQPMKKHSVDEGIPRAQRRRTRAPRSRIMGSVHCLLSSLWSKRKISLLCREDRYFENGTFEHVNGAF